MLFLFCRKLRFGIKICIAFSWYKLLKINFCNYEHLLQVEREYAKLLHSIGQHKEGLDVVSSSIAHFHEWGGDSSNSNTNGIGGGATLSALQKIKDKAQQGQCNELCARSLLTLVKWLQLDHKTLSNISSQLKNYIPSNECTTNGTSVRNIRLLLEMEENATPNGFELSLLSESQDKKGKLFNLKKKIILQ